MIKLLTGIASLLFFTGVAAAEDTYRILITNDDGIEAAGLKALVDVLHDDAEIIVSAPAKKESGTGHATHLWEGPMKIDKHTMEGASLSYGIHGMPADAARFGILMANKLGKKIDLVISGINSGDNVGNAAYISGTVGAAQEALYYNIPSIAVSLDGDAAYGNQYSEAANFIDTLVSELREHGLESGVMLNVNVPAKIKGVKATPMGDYVVEVKDFEITEDGYFVPEIIYPDSKEPGSDSYEFLEGYITITPMQLNATDAATLKALKNWKLED